jgi:glycosyltransferase involved in cell wall biosynthesis
MNARRSRDEQRPPAREKSRPAERVLVALPVFNEIRSVADVLRAVRSYASDILVVDDGSTDGTGDVLARHAGVRLLRHPVNLGYGRSLIDAFSHAREHEFPWVITMDCDGQHEPARLPHFRRRLAQDDADIISGSRYLQPHARGTVPPPVERMAINQAVTRLLKRHLGLHLTDAFCGFKAYRTAALAPLQLTDPGYGLPLQVWVQAARTGLRIVEIPVPLIYHDPRKGFAGILEDPRARLEYYVATLERELGYHVHDETHEWFDSLLCR